MFVFRDFECIFEFILEVICMGNETLVGNLKSKIRIEILDGNPGGSDDANSTRICFQK